MNERNVAPETYAKYVKFLNGIKNVLEKNESIYAYQTEAGVSKNTVSAMINLGFLQRVSRGSYKMIITVFEPFHAKKVIDEAYNIADRSRDKIKETETVGDVKRVPDSSDILKDFSDGQLASELRRRGYEGTLSKHSELQL